MQRRTLIRNAALLGLTPFGLGAMPQDFATPGTGFAPFARLKIGACDWSLGKGADPTAFEMARRIGLDGIQVNMGSEKDDLKLRKKEVQERYLQVSKETGVAIASLAIGELNGVPYKSDPRTEEWVWDSIDVANALGVPVILLAFFYKNDLRNDDAGKKEVIRRLKKVAPKAEKQGVILGIESYLSAEEHMEIIQAVGSPNVQVYYDFRNSTEAGYDVLGELRRLGKDLICELHMKENGYLLGRGILNWPVICETLIDMGYTGKGWMQIEGALPRGADPEESYKHNLAYLRKQMHD